ncbi:ABC transporter permease subunit [Paenibacillus sp. JJ-223]|uniref:ABC transporter permease subunit n=1 Tax=Paenibacillus sp. JJ-223 TaxID=2905647 RepID=UPI001F279B04|nr:ABC transporter permease subunit [Paenibacillus sp. JJ-223]CAH1192198.1 hypothetical protein PAECIP111890_00679 [Paenibacillus sp. JJ-223]
MFARELKANTRFTILWTFALSAWIVLISLFYPAFSENAAIIEKALESYPEAVRSLLGLSQDSLSSYMGFYTFVFNGVVELGAVQAMILGATVLFKERSGKTADFLFTKPVSRKQIMTSKLGAATLCLTFTTFVCFAVTIMTAIIISGDAVNMIIFFMIDMSLWFVQLIFMSLGLLIAVVFPNMKSATGIAVGSLLLSVIVYNALKPVMGGYNVRYLIPFHYFDSEWIVRYGSYEAPFVLTAILLIAASVAAGYAVYDKKDIHAA